MSYLNGINGCSREEPRFSQDLQKKMLRDYLIIKNISSIKKYSIHVITEHLLRINIYYLFPFSVHEKFTCYQDKISYVFISP